MWHVNEITMMIMVVDEEVTDTAMIVAMVVDIVMIVIETIVVEPEALEEIRVLLIIVEIEVVIAIIMMVGEEKESTMIEDAVEMISVVEDAIETIYAVLFVNVLLIVVGIAGVHQGVLQDVVVNTVDAVVLGVVLRQGTETTIEEVEVEEALPGGTMIADGMKIIAAVMAIDLKRTRVAVLLQIFIVDEMIVGTVVNWYNN